MMLSTQAVTDALMACLYKDDELDGGKPVEGQPDPIYVEGVVTRLGLHPDRVEDNHNRIRELLAELPKEFKQGWSFLQACNDKNGRQWTSFHRSMDELFCLGMAIGAVKMLAPRDMWEALPGGMPYLQVTL